MKEMTIKGLSALLQKRIDNRLKSFTDNYDKVKALTDEIEEWEKKMFIVVEELEPVQSLIYNQNPQLQRIFESLKRVYGGDNNGHDREVN